MNEKLLRLLELIKIYNGGFVMPLLEDEIQAIASSDGYEIKTIDDLIEAMETEISYWEE